MDVEGGGKERKGEKRRGKEMGSQIRSIKNTTSTDTNETTKTNSSDLR